MSKWLIGLKWLGLKKDAQSQLAAHVSVTRQTIGLIEKGKYNPTLQLCIALAKALDQTLNQLFWEGIETK